METQAFSGQANPHGDASQLRNGRRTWCIGACLILWVLSLLSFLIVCSLFHHKQSPPCWFHGSFPDDSPNATGWIWTGNCSGSEINHRNSSLEIPESGIYFTYIYVALPETISPENYLFTVELVTSLKEVLSVLKGPNQKRAFISVGRPYYLVKGTILHLDINEGLKHIDRNRTYWGLIKM